MSPEANSLAEKIAQKDFVVAVVGLGYVGLPQALAFVNAGIQVIGFDVDPRWVGLLNRGLQESADSRSQGFLTDGEMQILKQNVTEGNLIFTADPEQLGRAQAICICVPTPLDENREPNIDYVSSAAETVAEYGSKHTLIVLESTTYPGTTREVVLPKLEGNLGQVGVDFWLGYSPERVDPGNPSFSTENTPRVVSGFSDDCRLLTKSLFESFLSNVYEAPTLETAEMVKLHENIFRSVNIAMVNEMAILCRSMGINVWDVINLASTKPYGFMPFYPGPGLGGHCIPIDPFYLSWRVRKFHMSTKFIELAGDINLQMAKHVVRLVCHALNSQKRCLNGSKVLVLGVAYKSNVSDVRESPAIRIMNMLLADGAVLDYHDNYASYLDLGEERLSSIVDPDYSDYDCVVVITPHTYMDPDKIFEESKLIVDTRNFFGKQEGGKIFVL